MSRLNVRRSGAKKTPMARRLGWRDLCARAQLCAADALAGANEAPAPGRLENLRLAVTDAKKIPPPLENASEQAVAKSWLEQAAAFAHPATPPERRLAFAELVAAGARCVGELIDAAAPHPSYRRDIDG